MTTFAKRVKDRRLELGLNQSQVAKASGLKQPDISKIELGLILKTMEPLGLARALQCSPYWLTTGEGAMADTPSQQKAQIVPLVPAGGGKFATENVATFEQITEALAGYLMQMDDDARHEAADALRRLAHKPEIHARTAAMLSTAFHSGQRKSA